MRFGEFIFLKEARLVRLEVYRGGDQVLETKVPILVCKLGALIQLY